jgi:hypothetical protein
LLHAEDAARLAIRRATISLFMSTRIEELLGQLSSADSATRESAARELFRLGRAPADRAVYPWWSDAEFSLLFSADPEVTVGLAVHPDRFVQIRAANHSPRLADVPPDQDALEYELHFPGRVQLDILTTRAPSGAGAIAKFLEKFGEGVQQVEFRCTNVGRATQILKEKFAVKPIYPTTRAGADNTRVNFFLVASPGNGKVLIEIYESVGASS